MTHFHWTFTCHILKVLFYIPDQEKQKEITRSWESCIDFQNFLKKTFFNNLFLHDTILSRIPREVFPKDLELRHCSPCCTNYSICHQVHSTHVHTPSAGAPTAATDPMLGLCICTPHIFHLRFKAEEERGGNNGGKSYFSPPACFLLHEWRRLG